MQKCCPSLSRVYCFLAKSTSKNVWIDYSCWRYGWTVKPKQMLLVVLARKQYTRDDEDYIFALTWTKTDNESYYTCTEFPNHLNRLTMAETTFSFVVGQHVTGEFRSRRPIVQFFCNHVGFHRQFKAYLNSKIDNLSLGLSLANSSQTKKLERQQRAVSVQLWTSLKCKICLTSSWFDKKTRSAFIVDNLKSKQLISSHGMGQRRSS